MKRLVVGIAAHVDAGKTTLSEALLYKAGMLRRLGSVDGKDSLLDNEEIERRRGITVFSKTAVLRTEKAEFTLLDTPGHVDFSAETERALAVIDCAVLVVSGTDGVQPHTITLWEQLERFSAPVFVFVNKMDISHKSKEVLLKDLGRLNRNFAEYDGNFCEKTAEYDEACMNSLLESGGVPKTLAAEAVAHRAVFPVVFGSAMKMNNVDVLLELLENYSTPKERYEEFAAIVHKITTDENGIRLTHLKINGGELKNRAVVDNSDDKITQLRIYNGKKFTAVDKVEAGQLCAAAGLSQTFAGQALGAQKQPPAPLAEAFLTYKLGLPDGTDVQKMYANLKRLEEEDPQLKFSWSEREIHVSIMGEVQLEILENAIRERFGLSVTFGEGNISYRETIAEPVFGVGHYEPLRHYAEVQVKIEPLPAGSGVEFACGCAGDEARQKAILAALRERRHVGVLTGSPITDVRITLTAFRDHPKHTEGGDLRQAAWRAVRQGLASAKSVLLEPFYRFKLVVPQSALGRAMTDLDLMGAKFTQTDGGDEFSTLEGSCPVAKMRGYFREVTAYTHGAGTLGCVPYGYFPCCCEDEVIEKIGYNFESDVENSADSIFCSHGAGYLVKWNEVPEKMHIKADLRGENREVVTEAEINSYKRRAATDKELMEIFERTYGKINRSERVAMRRDKQTEKIPKLPAPKRGPEFLLVDGYNIIFSWEELAAVAKQDLDTARARLINILCNYQGFKQNNVILVFDAYKVKSDRETEKFGNLTVVYTKEAETADMFIEKAAHHLTAENRVRVASSDGTEQLIILGAGAVRVSARELKLEVDEVERSIRQILENML